MSYLHAVRLIAGKAHAKRLGEYLRAPYGLRGASFLHVRSHLS
jgi:hypothetical protein